jgi:hypothetical protein
VGQPTFASRLETNEQELAENTWDTPWLRTTEDLARYSDSGSNHRNCLQWRQETPMSQLGKRFVMSALQRAALATPGDTQHSSKGDEHCICIGGCSAALEISIDASRARATGLQTERQNDCPTYFALISASGIIALTLHKADNTLFRKLRLGTGCLATRILRLRQ